MTLPRELHAAAAKLIFFYCNAKLHRAVAWQGRISHEQDALLVFFCCYIDGGGGNSRGAVKCWQNSKQV